MTALYAFVEDLVAEGADAVLARIRSYGADEIALAFAYHGARDVTPHGPARVTHRQGGLRFVPHNDAFAAAGTSGASSATGESGRGKASHRPASPDDGDPRIPSEAEPLRPPAVPGALSRDEAAALVDQCRAAGVEPLGWCVFLHNERMGLADPEVAHENCFGNRAAPADLCPSNPRVREYAVNLARAVADLGVRTVVAESLHFGAFDHGYHHERSFVALGAVERFALGLCFCPHCERRAAEAGVDVAAARRAACACAAAPMDAAADATEPMAAADGVPLDPAVQDYARARIAAVTSLVAEVAAALSAMGARLCFLDLTGAAQGYGDGMPPAVSGVEEAWMLGVDPQAVSGHADYGILAYARDPERVASETARYRDVLHPDAGLRVLLRPGTPDCEEAANLARKVAGARAAGAASVDFYHYGLAPFRDLERIPVALDGAESGAEARAEARMHAARTSPPTRLPWPVSPVVPGVWLVGSGAEGFGLSDPLDCHVYLVDGPDSWALIDAGAGRDPERIVRAMTDTGLDLARPGRLLITHGHADHAGGAAALAEAFPSLAVWAGAAAREWIARGDELGLSVDRGRAQGVYPPEYAFRACPAVQPLADGAVIDLGGPTIEAIATPGHADGHLCYLLTTASAHGRGHRTLFSGDCLFAGGRISLQNLHDAHIPDYAASVARLARLGIDTLLPGHHAWVPTGAARHVDAAAAVFATGRVPGNA